MMKLEQGSTVVGWEEAVGGRHRASSSVPHPLRQSQASHHLTLRDAPTRRKTRMSGLLSSTCRNHTASPPSGGRQGTTDPHVNHKPEY
ncbi:hypothetical protein E2C01_005296 [Portunus trituberculatus]|uniref:Uncharacterized protein n=1 Tax=Portunus trituberculatus TaxID=210409 RepID=A0A5B7CYS5_PORTR|nr:hypothetical protein [Portunus trituberculatus]